MPCRSCQRWDAIRSCSSGSAGVSGRTAPPESDCGAPVEASVGCCGGRKDGGEERKRYVPFVESLSRMRTSIGTPSPHSSWMVACWRDTPSTAKDSVPDPPRLAWDSAVLSPRPMSTEMQNSLQSGCCRLWVAETRGERAVRPWPKLRSNTAPAISTGSRRVMRRPAGSCENDGGYQPEEEPSQRSSQVRVQSLSSCDALAPASFSR
mmetsp:Transcript_25218/g.59794  ORF Transcript_25218/g.59794 Transcript_25218/m.59794 type:complete len:207 (-) Transcript_25218:282-902(-)